MKKDIDIPKAVGLQLAFVHEYNSDFRVYDWNVYLINTHTELIEMVLIVTNGVHKKKKTSTMRHKIERLFPNTVAKIEYIPDEVLKLNNTYSISFFQNNQLFEKIFTVKKNSIQESQAQKLKLFNGSKGFIFE